MTNASHELSAPVVSLSASSVPARTIAVIAAVHPTSAQRWLTGSRPRGPALARLRRAARLLAEWPDRAPPFRSWLTTASSLLDLRSPAQWVGADGEDLPLAECWREATGASGAALKRAFPRLHVAAVDNPLADASLMIVERAMRDLDASGVQQMVKSLQGIAAIERFAGLDLVRQLTQAQSALAFHAPISDAVMAAAAQTSAIADAAQQLALTRAHVSDSLRQPMLETLAAASEAWKGAGLGLLEGLNPYRSLVESLPAVNISEMFRGIDLPRIDPGWASSLSLDIPWKDMSFGALSVAVDTSLIQAIGASLDAHAGLVEPFAREAAGWNAWLPRNPRAFEKTDHADPGWLSAQAHLLTRTSLAASAPDREARPDSSRIEEAVEAASRLSLDLDLLIPGTSYRLRDVLHHHAPEALQSMEGAIAVLAARTSDARRQAGVSIREAVKAISKSLTRELPPNTPARERWRAAVGMALNDDDHGAMVAAQIEVLLSVGGATSASVHGRQDDVALLEVVMKGVVAALCTVLAGWVTSADGRL